MQIKNLVILKAEFVKIEKGLVVIFSHERLGEMCRRYVISRSHLCYGIDDDLFHSFLVFTIVSQ